MQNTTTIVHRLMLALRLVDTTTGHNIPGRLVSVAVNGVPVRFLEKVQGVLLFTKLEPAQFTLSVCAKGYEPVSRQVDLHAAAQHMPLLELALLPDDAHAEGLPLTAMTGTLCGIRNLYAVRHRPSNCLVRFFDKRTKTLNIFNPNRLLLDGLFYAVVDEKKPCAEPIHIVRCIDEEHLLLQGDVTMALQSYCSISPMVMGRCEGNGAYCLKLRLDDPGANWVIGWTVREQTHFRLCALKDLAQLKLE